MKKEKLTFLDRVAVSITKMVGTVWCAIFFAFIAFIGLPYELHGGTSSFINWLTQTFLQLVLMSVILVGQNIQNSQWEIKEERDLETDLAIKKELEILMARIDTLESEKIDKILKNTELKTPN